MVSIESCQFGHHFYLTALDFRIAEIVVLILGPSGTHEHLHSVFGSGIHYCIDRTLPPLRIMPVHQLRRVVCLLFVGHRHEDEIFHSHLLHFSHLGGPQRRIGTVEMLRIGVFVSYVLIWQVDECAGHGKCIPDLFRGQINGRSILRRILSPSAAPGKQGGAKGQY